MDDDEHSRGDPAEDRVVWISNVQVLQLERIVVDPGRDIEMNKS